MCVCMSVCVSVCVCVCVCVCSILTVHGVQRLSNEQFVVVC